ncbi:MAG TPA: hypothetical protein PKZ41_05045 [Candidatus Omnitrophota bacterium]|nr:hypothetical protein [Candidatus Omnitrophota bacterium]
MYKRYAMEFNKKQREFINCVNIVERVKKARALPDGMSHLGVRRFVVTSSDIGKKAYLSVKDCK